VRGQIKAPLKAFYLYWVRLQSLAPLSWNGAFKLNALTVKSLWVPAKGIWIHSPVLVGVGVSHPQGYNIKIANLNPHGQDWEINVQIQSPYRCTKPDPSGFEP